MGERPRKWKRPTPERLAQLRAYFIDGAEDLPKPDRDELYRQDLSSDEADEVWMLLEIDALTAERDALQERLDRLRTVATDVARACRYSDPTYAQCKALEAALADTPPHGGQR